VAVGDAARDEDQLVLRAARGDRPYRARAEAGDGVRPAIIGQRVRNSQKRGCDMTSGPDYLAHARGIEKAISSVRDSSRRLSQHWPSDGEHREALVRAQLERKIPKRYQVKSGFILDSEVCSPQIDILVYDSERPIFDETAEGKIFVTPDAAKALIEVKSKLVGEKAIYLALEQLAKSAVVCGERVWTGLFVHEGAYDFISNPDKNLFQALKKIYKKYGVKIRCVSFGESIFVRYWENSLKEADGIYNGSAWHSYFIDHLAPAYFVGNIVAHLSRIPDEYALMWFPIPDHRGKESMRRWYMPLDGAIDQFPDHQVRIPEKDVRRQA
jgi:hypothetical protein